MAKKKQNQNEPEAPVAEPVEDVDFAEVEDLGSAEDAGEPPPAPEPEAPVVVGRKLTLAEQIELKKKDLVEKGK